MRSSWVVVALMALAVGSADARQARTILFIGNSFTLRNDLPLILSNAVTLTLVGTLLVLKLRYR